eukprot:2066461-Amphidinium_carterae.1
MQARCSSCTRCSTRASAQPRKTRGPPATKEKAATVLTRRTAGPPTQKQQEKPPTPQNFLPKQPAKGPDRDGRAGQQN